MIGSFQWAVTLGQFDILVGVMSLSRFRTAQCKSHLDWLKQIYGFLHKFPDAGIQFRTGTPNWESIFTPEEHDWMYTVYGRSEEELPHGMPEPRGKPVCTSSYFDASLKFCKVTGCAASGTLHFVQQTPIEWFSKKQNTVETATYGSEFIAA